MTRALVIDNRAAWLLGATLLPRTVWRAVRRAIGGGHG
jgi:hypothetical protein